MFPQIIPRFEATNRVARSTHAHFCEWCLFTCLWRVVLLVYVPSLLQKNIFAPSKCLTSMCVLREANDWNAKSHFKHLNTSVEAHRDWIRSLALDLLSFCSLFFVATVCSLFSNSRPRVKILVLQMLLFAFEVKRKRIRPTQPSI